MGNKKAIVCPSCQALNRVDQTAAQQKQAVCGKCGNPLSDQNYVINISENLLEKIIKHSEVPVVIDAYADWCGPCKMYGPIFEEVAKEDSPKAQFFKVDTEKNQSFAMKYGIRGIPTTLVFHKGKLVTNQSGLLQKEQLKSLLS